LEFTKGGATVGRIEIPEDMDEVQFCRF
jgi:hypothetical protein